MLQMEKMRVKAWFVLLCCHGETFRHLLRCPDLLSISGHDSR